MSSSGLVRLQSESASLQVQLDRKTDEISDLKASHQVEMFKTRQSLESLTEKYERLKVDAVTRLNSLQHKNDELSRAALDHASTRETLIGHMQTIRSLDAELSHSRKNQAWHDQQMSNLIAELGEQKRLISCVKKRNVMLEAKLHEMSSLVEEQKFHASEANAQQEQQLRAMTQQIQAQCQMQYTEKINSIERQRECEQQRHREQTRKMYELQRQLRNAESSKCKLHSLQIENERLQKESEAPKAGQEAPEAVKKQYVSKMQGFAQTLNSMEQHWRMQHDKT